MSPVNLLHARKRCAVIQPEVPAHVHVLSLGSRNLCRIFVSLSLAPSLYFTLILPTIFLSHPLSPIQFICQFCRNFN